MVAPEWAAYLCSASLGSSPEEPPGLVWVFLQRPAETGAEACETKFPASDLSQLLLDLGAQKYQNPNYLKVTWSAVQLNP